jgi:hypothetical protein
VPVITAKAGGLWSSFPWAKIETLAGCWWLMSVILSYLRDRNQGIKVQSQPRQIDLTLKIPNTKRDGGVAQGPGLEFKPWN